MGIKSLGQPTQPYNAVWNQTGKEAVSAAPTPIGATGGTKTTYDGKTIHTITSTTPFVLEGGPLAIEYVIIGGGASGGSNGTNAYGTGGGGAGQVRTGTTTIADGTWTATIGAGGATTPEENVPGNNGSNSSAAFPSGTITGYGGGGGAANGPPAAYSPGKDGVNYPSPTAGSGSGGGAGRDLPGITYDGGPSALGAYPGGQGGHPGQYAGCGGGGAGGAGGDGPPTSGPASPTSGSTVGYGGLALQLPTTFRDPATAPTTGTPGPSGTHWVGGGGSGGLYSNPDSNTVQAAFGGAGPGGGGPYGGGGNGGSGTTIDGSAGLDNTGGGGGGGGAKVPAGGDGGAGGSGLILIAYDS